MTILAFILGVVITLFVLGIVTHYTQPQNKVHFYVARDKNKTLWLYMEKPTRNENLGSWTPTCRTLSSYYDFERFGLNIDDYKDLTWEDKPVEVFLKLED